LETLRHCLPPSVRRTLNELPESLDETYERVLKEIKKPNRGHARRLLQCLVVAIRPLRVSELAEVLAVDFDDEEGTPKLNPNWRWEDQEQALLSSCSSLIAIVESDESRIVQFSHFSVKEFLTSARLATSIGDISGYYIVLESAHTILAQACMGVLLRSDDRVEEGGRNSSPLARYAAKHWVAHAQDEKVLSCLRKGMEDLLDLEKPYFAAWLGLHDIDTASEFGSPFHDFTPHLKSDATPLYYAARNGFQDLVEHLVANDPKQVNATGGYYLTPLVAALALGHFRTAKFLHDKGAHPNVSGFAGTTPLHSAALNGDFEMVQVLLNYKAEVNARNSYGRTALHYASQGRYHEGADANFALSLTKITRLLLEHGADVNAREFDRLTPLHVAARYGRIDVLRVLLEHCASTLGVADDDRKTAFHEHVGARDSEDKTPLHIVSESPYWGDPNVAPSLSNIVRLLLEYGADVNARRNDLFTPLHVAARYGRVELACILLDHGANVAAEDEDGKTASEYASEMGRKEITKLLLGHRAE
jgi:ankyrin repeat protein